MVAIDFGFAEGLCGVQCQPTVVCAACSVRVFCDCGVSETLIKFIVLRMPKSWRCDIIVYSATVPMVANYYIK